ncbi:unnamed protein product [Gemmataceae bacterium]|nr:unnamed protein product [Gemmataceae bacterium]VTT98081.1 unnamed protein product [Gemmataceae bacterium]
MLRYLAPVLGCAVLLSQVGATAPVPKDRQKGGIPAADIPKLIGKSHFSPELVAVHRAMKNPPTARYYYDTTLMAFCHDWKMEGLMVRYDADGNTQSISMCSGATDEFGAYPGELPFGLTFADAKPQVEKKLGKATEEEDGIPDKIRCGWRYPAKGLDIEFDTYDPDDAKARISWVSVYKPKK